MMRWLHPNTVKHQYQNSRGLSQGSFQYWPKRRSVVSWEETSSYQFLQKDNTPLDDANRRQLIRDCVTCLEAHVDCKHLTSEHFTEVAKQLCESVPLLRDEKPIHWPDDIEFQDWVIWIIIIEIFRLCWSKMQNSIGL